MNEKLKFSMPDFFNAEALEILTHNVGQLLMFVMPILLLLLAIIFSGRFIEMTKKALKVVFRRDQKDWGYDRENYREQKKW